MSDEVTIKIFSPYISEVTKRHHNIPLQENTKRNRSNYKYRYKNDFSIAKELKQAREKILTNILPEDIDYLYFVTITTRDSGINDIADDWNNYRYRLKEEIGSFEYIAVFEKGIYGNYHIHALIFDKTHSDSFRKINYKIFTSICAGNVKVSRIKDLDALISTAYYITKSKNRKTGKNTYTNNEIPSTFNMYCTSDDIIDVPEEQPFCEDYIIDMKCSFSTSYRLSGKNYDCNFTRSMYVKQND